MHVLLYCKVSINKKNKIQWVIFEGENFHELAYSNFFEGKIFTNHQEHLCMVITYSKHFEGKILVITRLYSGKFRGLGVVAALFKSPSNKLCGLNFNFDSSKLNNV